MEGRNHPYPRTLNSRPSNIVDTHRLNHNHRETQANPAAVVEAQQREIQILLRDNRRLAENHVVLKRELAAAHQELRHLSSTAVKVKADCDARVREVYESSLKTEAELRSLDATNVELVQVKSDIENMTAESKELTAKLDEINKALASSASELEGFPAIEEELQTMRQEIKRGRAAIEYEKKLHASNLEQSEVMDKNIVSMTREIEKLRVELADAEKRAREEAAAAAAAAVPAPPGTGYPSVYATADGAYGGNYYAEHYPLQQVQVHGGINASQYSHGGVPHVPATPYDFQRSNVHR